MISDDSTPKAELWSDPGSDTVWKRAPHTGEFQLLSISGLPPKQGWTQSEIAFALGCPTSIAEEDGARADAPVVFPPSFVHSPNTGRKLVPPAPKRTSAWIPLNGSQDLEQGLLRGGKLTNISLLLQNGYSSVQPAPLGIPKLPSGPCCMLVWPCGLRSLFLFALDSVNGRIYCWQPSDNKWSEMQPADEACPFLASEQLPYGTWSVEPIHAAEYSSLYWPSDAGLLALTLNPLSMQFAARVVSPGRCMSPVLPLGGRHYFLQQRPDAPGTALVSIDPEAGSPIIQHAGIPNALWACSAATPLEAVWISNLGQVVASTRRHQFDFIPWEPDAIEPLFNFGPPHYARDGRLWMQVRHPRATPDGEEGLCFISLGKSKYEQQSFLGVRLLSGQSSFKVEQRIQEDPWNEPKVAPGAHQKDEIVLPILESVADRSVLVLRAYHDDSAESFLANETTVTTRFQVHGQHADDYGFYQIDVTEPWLTRAFIYDGALYLYHPKFETLPGWLLQSAP